MSRVPTAVREQVRKRANSRCEYCHLPEGYSRIRHQVDHITARRHGGSDELDNLAWACFYCNNNKSADLSSIDPLTKQRAWLFHPREQTWSEHFELDSAGLMVGKTSEGRTTIHLLDINNPKRVEIRLLLLKTGRL